MLFYCLKDWRLWLAVVANHDHVKSYHHLAPTRHTHYHAHLQQLLAQWHLQTDVLRPLDGQPVDGVVVDHVRDAVEWSAELAQDVLSTWCQLDPHVHESMTASETRRTVLKCQKAGLPVAISS